MFASRAATRSALYWAIVVYTALGLVSGVFYREYTKHAAFTGVTELSVLHTHLLTLGTIVCLVLLCLEQVFHLSADKRFGAFFWTYTGGVALTVTMMTVIGVKQVGSPGATDPALAGIAGMGHLALTVALVLLLMILKARLAAVAKAEDGR